MTLIITKGGLLGFCERKRRYLNTCRLRLFNNNIMPSADDLADDYFEPLYDGYEPEPIHSMGLPWINPSGKAQTDSDVFYFLGGAVNPDVIYGYFCTDRNGNLVLAERYAFAPFVMNGTFTFTVQLSITDGQ